MVIGMFILVFSGFVLIPVPFSNFVPGLGIIIISFGLLGKDGLILTLGICIGITGMVISVIAMLLGVEAFNYIIEIIFGGSAEAFNLPF